MIHHLKTLPEYFQAVIDERKPFEIRENDRNFKTGDRVILEEYTGKELVPACPHFKPENFDIDPRAEQEYCKMENCEECRNGKCGEYIKHNYTGRTCNVIIKDIFDISFLIPGYVAFTFEIKHKRI
ncbi:MAG: DUF3850 domain-containing protein [Clostridia bacterium]|nr:DUF3850 domain-containing protein [Clostridia bacterium]